MEPLRAKSLVQHVFGSSGCSPSSLATLVMLVDHKMYKKLPKLAAHTESATQTLHDGFHRPNRSRI
eukprot:713048-Amphidinium_carterae.1